MIDDPVMKILREWLTNPPDFWDVNNVYDTLGDLKKRARLLRRRINATEDEIDIEVDKPRSNEVKKRKLEATRAMADELAEVEANIEYGEMQAKKLEFAKTMFQSSGYILKSRTDLT